MEQKSQGVSLLPRKRPRPLTCLADPAEMQGPPLSGLHSIWKVPASEYRFGRKYWEWDYLAECARVLGLLRPDARALGLGVGREPLIFYFAREVAQVVATDLYSSNTHWNEASAADLRQIYDAAPFEYPRERLTVQSADMRATGLTENYFDFVWSCGSIEHVPTLYDFFLALKEYHRVLKPGGYALVTTEYCLSEPPFLLAHTNALDEHLIETFIGQLGGLELVGPTDLSYNFVHPVGAVVSRRYMHAPKNGSQQCALPGDYVHMMGISAIVPVGFVLRKTDKEFANWEDLPLAEEIRVYENARNVTLQPDPGQALSALAQLAFAATPAIGRQFHLQVTALLLERVNQLQFPPEVVSQVLDLFSALLPQGELQDANLLSMVSAVHDKRGDFKKAERLLRMASFSPGAFADHVLAISLHHLNLTVRMGLQPSIEDPLYLNVEDLLKNGYSAKWIEEQLVRLLSVQPLPAVVQTILDRAKKSVSDAVQTRLFSA